jgi:hypothetical protein
MRTQDRIRRDDSAFNLSIDYSPEPQPSRAAVRVPKSRGQSLPTLRISCSKGRLGRCV